MKQDEIPIFFTVDESYAPYLDCAIRSMMENASKSHTYQIIVLHEDLTEESQEKLSAHVKSPFQIRFLSMQGAKRKYRLTVKDKLAGITNRAENRLRCDYFTLTIYFRLFIADLFPEYDKGIYLDSDIVVPGDISRLFQTELGDNVIAACPDRSITTVPELVEYVENAVGVPIDRYINSGILVMNLKKMREMGFSGHFLHLLQTYHFDCLAPDQDYFNAMCSGEIVYLDESWDAMPPEGGGTGAILEHPNLIHYNLFQKPWCYDNIPYEEYFWRYAKDSPFYEDILRHKETYSEEQKASDRTCLGNMVRKGPEVCKQPITFRKMNEKGEQIRVC
ncbi:MAG: glycosyltransferase family 8 protein [Clostridiales bacterium]|nr:glycosyltransferase family 8 protein [Clostridiales bacterium]